MNEFVIHLYIYKATDILFGSINIMLNLCIKSTGSWDAQILSQAKQEEIVSDGFSKLLSDGFS